MENLNKEQRELKQVIDNLINTATTYDVETLDQIYHKDLDILMYDISGELNRADKETFKQIFAQKRKAGDPPMNTWVKYHHIEVKNSSGHILLSRKNNLSGTEKDLFLSIDLILESNRWQVKREVIFLQPSNK